MAGARHSIVTWDPSLVEQRPADGLRSASLRRTGWQLKGAIIEARDMVKTYVTGDGFTPALKGVSLAVEPGEFLAIIGPSGSGKSTLMNLLGLPDTPTSGTYLIRGAEVRAREIGFVFQSFNLSPRATVMRNVMLPLMYCCTPDKERTARAMAAMEAAGLPEELHLKHSNQISGGQTRCVAIARAHQRLLGGPTASIG